MAIKFSAKDKQQLRILGVTTVYLFGSRAQGVAGPLSDYDYGLLLGDPSILRDIRAHMKLYQKLYDVLSDVSPRTLKNDVIDIIFLDEAPLELRMHIVHYGKVLFDEKPLMRGRFIERTIEEYCDYHPLLQMFNNAVLARI